MDISVLWILWSLIERACVVLLIFVLLFHINFFKRMLSNNIKITDQVVLSIIFGALAVYGTYSGVSTTGAIANIRNIGPMIGGLLAGPWVGLISGLIGGIHRYFIPGGFTCIPCALGTVLSGLIGGFLYMLLKGKISIWKSALFAFLMELADMALILLIAKPFDKALALVNVIAIPMIIADTIGVFVFAVLLSNMKNRQTQ